MKKIVFLFGVVAFSAASSAGPVSTRLDLNTLLGASLKTDNFEGFNVADNTAIPNLLVNQSLTNTTNLASQGSGFVNAGVSYSVGALQWQGANYFGLPTKTILDQENRMEISFTLPQRAVGFDLRAYQGFGRNARVIFYNGTTILSNSVIPVPDPSAVFVGWEDDVTGITRVSIRNVEFNSFGAILDDVSYGALVPEPSSLLVLGLGALLLRKRKKIPVS